MTTTQQSQSNTNYTSEDFANTEWLDAHFLYMQPEYEEMLRWVGLQPGWHVLDAGCGGGSFLPLMTELVGADGKVSALDLTPGNIQAVEKRAQQSNWHAPVFARVGTVTDLPYEDNSFDAVWCANVSQYLTDDEVTKMLSEFRRVVRPGGLVAVKEYDITTQLFQPLPPRLFPSFQAAMVRSGSTEYAQEFRAIDLQRWLRRAGLLHLRQKPTLMNRFQPVPSFAVPFIQGFLSSCSAAALKLDLPADELQAWKQLVDFDSPNHILRDPDFQYRAIQTVFVGTVP